MILRGFSISAERQQRIQRIATDVAGKLREVDNCPHDFCIASGNAGLALLFAHLDRCCPEDGWHKAAHRHLTFAANTLQKSDFAPPGLFDGVAGTAFTARYLAETRGGYTSLISTLDSYLDDLVASLALHIQGASGLATSMYDCISGVAGILAYLCSYREAASSLRVVFDAVNQLADSPGFPPSWYTPPDLTQSAHLRGEFPNGHINLGLAHGGPGLLAALAIAHQREHLPSTLSAMQVLSQFIVAQATSDIWGLNWPAAISSLSESTAIQTHTEPEVTKAAWCYGAPGVANALRLAGRYIASPECTAVAYAAIDTALTKPRSAVGLFSPTFCHGLAGLLYIASLFNAESSDSQRTQHVSILLDTLVDAYDPSSRYGFRNIGELGEEVDSPWLLAGSAGVALTLSSFAFPEAPRWDRVFLLS